MKEERDWWAQVIDYVNYKSMFQHPLLLTRQRDGMAFVHDAKLCHVVPCNKPATNDRQYWR